MNGVAVIGLGGLGSPAAWALARGGIPRLGLFDGDRVEDHNLPRQTLFDDGDLGKPKAEVAVRKLSAFAPRIEVVARAERIGPTRPDLLKFLSTFAVWVDATDQLQSKLWFNDKAIASRRLLVHGGAIRFGGQALFIAPGAGPCLRCLIEPDESDAEETCAAEGIAGPVVGVVGSLMAELALQALSHRAAPGRCLRFDALRGELRESTLPRRSGCPACGALGSGRAAFAEGAT
jgi:molybdopterin-synthase adenylyltransferase